MTMRSPRRRSTVRLITLLALMMGLVTLPAPTAHAGGAQFYGSTGAITLNEPIVGMAPTPSGRGYWLVARDGGIFAFGDAQFHGSTGGSNVPLPIVGMAVTNTGRGYWLAGANGAVYAFGDAPWHGQVAPSALTAAIVDIEEAEFGTGYWLTGTDGSVHTFGNATYHGDARALDLNSPVLDMMPSPHGYGYWLLARDGGVFSYGSTAAFYGSTGGIDLNEPIVGGASAKDGRGYWFVAADGGVFAFGGSSMQPRPPHSLVPRRIPTASAPLRVMTLGDSMAISFQGGLELVMESTGRAEVIPQGKWAYGFTAQYPMAQPCIVCEGFSHYGPASLDTHVRYDNFDAIVLMVGGWDYVDRIVDGVTLEAGTPAWQEWYRGVQDDAIRRLTSGGGVVYWAGYPACDVSPPKEAIFNALAAGAAARHPGRAVYLDLHGAVCPDGPLLALELPDGTPVALLNDGAHFTPGGASWVGYWLTSLIGATFQLPPPA